MNIFEASMVVMQFGAAIIAFTNSQYTKGMYWVGAFILTIAVVRGMK